MAKGCRGSGGRKPYTRHRDRASSYLRAMSGPLGWVRTRRAGMAGVTNDCHSRGRWRKFRAEWCHRLAWGRTATTPPSTSAAILLQAIRCNALAVWLDGRWPFKVAIDVKEISVGLCYDSFGFRETLRSKPLTKEDSHSSPRFVWHLHNPLVREAEPAEHDVTTLDGGGHTAMLPLLKVRSHVCLSAISS